MPPMAEGQWLPAGRAQALELTRAPAGSTRLRKSRQLGLLKGFRGNEVSGGPGWG